jgi:hypothetical protein
MSTCQHGGKRRASLRRRLPAWAAPGDRWARARRTCCGARRCTTWRTWRRCSAARTCRTCPTCSRRSGRRCRRPAQRARAPARSPCGRSRLAWTLVAPHAASRLASCLAVASSSQATPPVRLYCRWYTLVLSVTCVAGGGALPATRAGARAGARRAAAARGPAARAPGLPAGARGGPERGRSRRCAAAGHAAGPPQRAPPRRALRHAGRHRA